MCILDAHSWRPQGENDLTLEFRPLKTNSLNNVFIIVKTFTVDDHEYTTAARQHATSVPI